ncbi:hypothetical protein CTAYLR_008888 [Chrysophaeum taylorii]|uniref:Serine/threonine-protein kinase RIO2 n=1 Tax=Chrysophaeum taylorii TaxID=2483200 RepID=A0AAD7UK54_9STRA|nr:hypothetical protein CTAYLR_008888 [Chrysophaeum taylorii]
MGKLDAQIMRHMSREDFRVLTAVELGMRNHHAVPVPLVVSIAGLRHGGAHKLLNTLLRFKLVYHDRTKYDGYRLTWTGYDVLALHALCRRGTVDRLGAKIGEGKESDVYEGYRDSDGATVVIKFHRLGKTSFKAVKAKRDYLDGRVSAGNWLNMSRLAANREWAFLEALSPHFQTPAPLDHNRHAVVMSLAPGHPMYQINHLEDPRRVFETCLGMARDLARRGLVHCDLNEFNLIVDDPRVTLIDFPQMVSTNHPNAAEYFRRDVRGLLKFFESKLKFDDFDHEPDAYDDLASIPQDLPRIDLEVKASGYDNASSSCDKRLLGGGGDDKEEGEEEEEEEEDSDDDDDDDDDDNTLPAAAR